MSEPDYDVKKLEKLLDLMADDLLTDEDVETLQEILLGSEQARQKYINFNFVDDSLYWSYAEAAVDNRRDREYFKETVKSDKPQSFTWLAAAAALLIGFFVAIQINKTETPVSYVAKISESSGAKWSTDVSKNLTEGPLKLVSGEVKILFNCGAEMTVKAPAEIELKSHIHARLIRGKVRLHAPNSAIGFRLETQASNFVDIGTEFEVSVDDQDKAEIHVLEGVVVARSNGNVVIPFGKNESGIIDPEYGEVVSIRKKEVNDAIIAPSKKSDPKIGKGARIIFFGERNVDLETYLHMINQAIYDKDPENAPVILNAGLRIRLECSDEDYEKHVKRMRPTHAVFAFGSVRSSFNINHDPEWFSSYLNKFCDRLEEDGIQPILHIGFPLRSDQKTMKIFDIYKRVLLSVAEERGYMVGRADKIWDKYKAEGRQDNLAHHNGLALSYAGHKAFARSFLDLFGYADAEVPHRLRLKPLPGIIKEWKWQEFVNPPAISSEYISSLKPSGWSDIILPLDTEKGYTSRLINPYMNYNYQAKQLGMAVEMTGRPQNIIRAVSSFEAERDEVKYLNIGGGIREIWFNGKLIKSGLRGRYVEGRHPGVFRFPVKVRQGTNTIILDTSMSFFVSLTSRIDWGLQKP